MRVGAIVIFCAWMGMSFTAEAQSNGPLRVHPDNPRYFTDDSGQAILLTGSHTWNNIVDMGPSDPPQPFDFDAYLAWLKSYGHNFTRGWAWEPTRFDITKELPPEAIHYVTPQPWLRTGDELAQDGRPKFDLDQLNPAYFERLRQRVEAAQKADIFISVMFFEGYSIQFLAEAWPNHPFNPANNINRINGDPDGDGRANEIYQLIDPKMTAIQETLARKVVETLDDYDNVLFEIGNEINPASYEWQCHMVKFVKQVQADLPKQHPVGMTHQQRGGDNDKLFASPADWISPNHWGGYRNDPPDRGGQKVVLSDTDHLWGVGGNAAWVWKTVTRGLNPIFMDHYDGAVVDGKATPQHDPARRAMGCALSYTRRMNLAASVPRGELASSGFCLAEPGAAYLIFVPGGGEVEVDLTGAPGNYTVEWHNPTSAESSSGEMIQGGTKQRITAAFAGDSVLFLKKAV